MLLLRKISHIKLDCKKKKHDENRKRSITKHKSNAELAEIAWKLNDITYINEKDWCIGSGATSYMTSDRSIFVEYEDFKSTVHTADRNVNLAVLGSGKVVCLFNGANTIFEGVLHIPEPCSNLLSPGKPSSAGFSVSLEPEKVIISHSKKTVAIGPRVGDTWVLCAYNSQEQAYKTEKVAKLESIL